MKMMKTPVINHETIASYLAGEMDSEQQIVFREAIRRDRVARVLFDDLQKCWNLMNVNPSTPMDSNQAWENLLGRLQDEGLVSSVSTSSTTEVSTSSTTEASTGSATQVSTGSTTTWLKWAAAILILISLGTFALYRSLFTFDSMMSVYNSEEITLVHTLIDGSVVYLSPGTRIDYTGDNARNLILSGEAFFDVVHNKTSPFTINTQNAIIEVLGTSFNVNNKENLEVFVETGEVRVRLTDRQVTSINLVKGEMLVLDEDIPNKFQVHPDFVMDWRKNTMQFKDELLANIVSVINQNYNSKLVLGEPELNQRRLTVTFHNNSIPLITELISASLNLEIEIFADSTIVLKQRK
jgi:ferric-dicitrate binding protein FerR (iron transport regulator)